MKKIKKLDMKSLFSNNKFLIIFSFVLACSFWIGSTVSMGEDSDRIIYNIPVTIELPQESGLTTFNGSDTKVSVPIKGNRLAIGAVTADDIQVVALNTNSVVPGTNNTFQLQAKKNGSKSDYELGSPTPSIVNVYVDKLIKRDFDIDFKIEYKINPNYYSGAKAYSAENVTVSGPAAEINKIESVVVKSQIANELSSSKTINGDVKLYDSRGTEISSDFITLSVKTVEITIPVLPEKKVPLKVNYKNIPAGFNTDNWATISPAEIQIAGPEDTINKLDYISLDAIDFSHISPTENKFKLDIIIPSDCTNITNVNVADVSLNMNGYSSKTFTITNFITSNVPSGYTATPTTTTLDLVIVGPESTLETLTSTDIYCILDLSSVAKVEGSIPVDVAIKVKNSTSCWLYGTYKANANIKAK